MYQWGIEKKKIETDTEVKNNIPWINVKSEQVEIGLK